MTILNCNNRVSRSSSQAAVGGSVVSPKKPESRRNMEGLIANTGGIRVGWGDEASRRGVGSEPSSLWLLYPKPAA